MFLPNAIYKHMFFKDINMFEFRVCAYLVIGVDILTLSLL